MTNKIKIVKNGGSSYLVYKSEKNQSLSERELYIINTGSVVGLLPVTVEQKGKSYKLSYNITGLVPVKDYIKNTLNKSGFSTLLSNIVESIESLEKSFLKTQFVIFDEEFVMVNPSTQKVYFPFVPIHFFESGTHLKEFLLKIAYDCNFLKSEDTSYVNEYIKILKKGINFSFFELTEFSKSLVNGTDKAERKLCSCPNCKSAFAFGMNYCPVCGMKIGTKDAIPENAVYNPTKMSDAHSLSDSSNPNPNYYQAQSAVRYVQPQESFDNPYRQAVNPSKPQNGYNPFEAEKQVHRVYEGEVNQGFNSVIHRDETVPIDYSQMYFPGNNAPKGFLVSKRTGEKVYVTKTVFVIGKDGTAVDYCVKNNNSVSRRHGEIIIEDNAFYYIDLGSTNKSFINGKLIPPQTKQSLNNGTSLTLADEHFTFYFN